MIQCGVLSRGGRRDEQVLRQLLEVAHRLLREHHPAQAPARHAEIFGEAVDHDHVAGEPERGPRLRAVGQALVDLVDDQHALLLLNKDRNFP